MSLNIVAIFTLGALVAHSTALIIRHGNQELQFQSLIEEPETADTIAPKVLTELATDVTTFDDVTAVTQTTTLVAKLPQFNFPDLPGFIYGKTAQKLSLMARQGYINPTHAGHGESSWQFSSSSSGKTITKKLCVNQLLVSYENTTATVGDVTTQGELVNDSRNTTMGLTLTASAPGGEVCKLTLTVEFFDTVPHLTFNGFGESGKAFEAPDVLKGLELVVGKTAGVELAEEFTRIFNKDLRNFMDVEGFCRELQKGSADKFPRPKF